MSHMTVIVNHKVTNQPMPEDVPIMDASNMTRDRRHMRKQMSIAVQLMIDDGQLMNV